MPNAPPLVDPEKAANAEAMARYVAEMAGDLACLARGQGLDTLSFILEMAKLEAENCARGAEPRR